MPRWSQTFEERFWSKVDKKGPAECWLWLGVPNSEGYGRIKIRGVSTRAHRYMLESHIGRTLKSGLLACHHCDVRLCVNPEHLYEGTGQQNSQDAVTAHTNHLTKLTVSEVLYIRNSSKTGISRKSLGKVFGVATQTIDKIINRETWRHV